MACSIKFVRLNDFTSDIDVLDLSSGGYALANDGYFPVVAPIGARIVHEVITLKLQGTSKDDLAAMTQEINTVIQQVQWWLDDPAVERYQVWIRVQQENETNPRQAQITDILPPDSVRLFTPEEWRDNYIGGYSIGIDRTSGWESLYSYPEETFTGLSPLGSMASFTNPIGGDMPARLPQVRVFNVDTGGFAGSWIGFKSSRFGDPDNFIPTWPINLSADLTDTTEVADSTAYDNSKRTCTFGTVATLTDRAIVYLSDIAGGNEEDFRGSYTLLVRAKMSDTSVARARVGFGFAPTTRDVLSIIYRSRQVISGTDWKLYEMGSISIPPSRITIQETLTRFSIALQAERISGAGNLEMDCFILIPTEGMIKAIGDTTPAVDTASQLRIHQTADGTIWSYAVTGSGPTFDVDRPMRVSPVNWSLPNGQTKLNIVYADAMPGDIKAKSVSVACVYIPRWRTLRGNDS